MEETQTVSRRRARRPAPATPPVPHETTPEGWTAQYQRMDRAYGRFSMETLNGDAYVDAVRAFFIQAWALVDWIANDPAAVPAIVKDRATLEAAVFQHDALVRGRDVANGAKHRVLTKPHAGGREDGRVLNISFDRPHETWVMYRFAQGDPEEGLALARRMVAAWDTLLPTLGLDPNAWR